MVILVEKTVYCFLLVSLLLVLSAIAVIKSQPLSPSKDWCCPRSCYSGLRYSLSKGPDISKGPVLIKIGRLFLGVSKVRIVVCEGKALLTNESHLLCIDYKARKILWAKSGSFGYPRVVDGKVYICKHVGGLLSTLYCYDLNTGNEVFKIEKIPLTAGLVVTEDKLYFATISAIECRDLNSKKIIWKTNIEYGCISCYYDGKLYVISTRALYCIDAETGKILWKRGEYRAAGKPYFMVTAVDGKIVFFHEVETVPGKAYSHVCVLDANTGKTLWLFKVEGIPASLYDPYVRDVAIAYGRIYFTYEYHPLMKDSCIALVCLDLNTGKCLWEKKFKAITSGIFEPAVADGKVYVTVEHDGVYCFDANTGEVLCNRSTIPLGKALRLKIMTAPSIADGLLFVIGDIVKDIESYGIVLAVFGTSATKPSSIEFSAEPTQLTVGSEVTLSIQLTPAKTTTVYIEASYEGEEWEKVRSVQLTSGVASVKWKPSKAGLWRVRVRWPGDNEYSPAVSSEITIQVLKVKPSIKVSAPSAATYGKEFTIEISINPPLQGVSVKITYTSPTGSTIVHSKTTDSEGKVKDSVTLSEEGEWSITVEVMSTEDIQGSKETFKIQVKKELGLTMSQWLIIAVVIAVVAVTAIVIVIKLKKPQPPPPPQ